MTDAELRALVRDAVARHLGTAPRAPIPEPASALLQQRPSSWTQHPSHHIYLQVVNTTDACVIEPAVSCDHCGYCKSHGH
ncbi:MAG: hypothetical protein ABI634_11430 [Acidobacteriota bacterium]